MDWGTLLGLLKYLFMGIFIIFFIADIKSKKSYKIHCYIYLTIAIVISVMGWQWSTGSKVGFIALIVLVTVKTILDEIKKSRDNDGSKIGV